MTNSSSATLKQRVLRAGVWSFAGYGLGQVLRLGGNLVMTRLLVPEMFGIMAIAIMISVILELLSDLGIRQNIVQSPRGDDPVFLNTAWIIQILRGGILWLIALVFAVALHIANLHGVFPVNSAYASPVLPFVIAASSFSAAIAGLSSTKMATADRNLNQSRLVQIEVISQFAGLIVTIVIGAITRSIWALVAGGLIATVTTTILSHAWMNGHSNRLCWDGSAFRELIGFGKWIFASSAVYVIAANGDRILLGGFVDAHVLGLYAIAVLIINAISNLLNRLFATISLPALSEIVRNQPSRLREIYYKLRLPGDLLMLFVMGLLFTAGQLLINVLYDQRYAAAGGMLQILAVSLFSVRYGVAHQIYLAVGMPRYLTAINVARLITLFALVPGLYYVAGVNAAVWGIATHGLVTLPLTFYFNAKLRLNSARRELVVLAALPAGLLCGSGLNLIFG